MVATYNFGSVYTYKNCSEVRLLQDTQGVRMANNRAPTHAFCLQMPHNRATTLRFIKNNTNRMTTYEVRTTFLPPYLQ